MRILRKHAGGVVLQPIRDQFQARLSNRLNSTVENLQTEWDARPAAVLVPLFFRSSEWHLLFTRRTESVNSHRGQVSFPGGLIEPSDASPEAAAVREAAEEIGLAAEQVKLIGRLDPLLTVSQFIITPVVGVVSGPLDLQINHHEVAAVFDVPLAWLMDEANLETRSRTPPFSKRPIQVFYFKPYHGEVVWGATARMTVQLLEGIRESGALAST